MQFLSTTLLVSSLLMAATPALASTIFAPVNAVVDVGGSNSTSILDTINQSGLSIGYVTNVTNFNAYIASNPVHTAAFISEWFSVPDNTAATVTYDFGGARTFDQLALWNEESAGIGSFDLLGSLDGITFTPFGASYSPFDNIVNADRDYPAEIFSFGVTNARFVRLNMSGCPQANPGRYPGCAIGEVAFRNAADNAVPEPATWAMMLLGFAFVGAAMRRNKQTLRVRYS